jgi:hypothetical protein
VEDYVVEQFFDQAGRISAHPHADDGSLTGLEVAASEARDALRVFRDDPRIIATLGADDFAEGLARREAISRAAVQALEDARSALGAESSGITTTTLREVWPSLGIEERRQLLAVAVDAVFIRRGRGRRGDLAGFVYISWKGEGIDVPRRGCRSNGLMEPFVFGEAPSSPRMAASK